LLPRAPRTSSGYREFAEAAVERLAFVKRAKDLEFSLKEVRELLVFQDEHADPCAEVRDLLRNKLTVIRKKKAELERLETHLSGALRKCNQALKRQTNRHETCPVLGQMAHPDSHNGGQRDEA
jgi:DNA-binding transcriptional MerR regulator